MVNNNNNIEDIKIYNSKDDWYPESEDYIHDKDIKTRDHQEEDDQEDNPDDNESKDFIDKPPPPLAKKRLKKSKAGAYKVPYPAPRRGKFIKFVGEEYQVVKWER